MSDDATGVVGADMRENVTLIVEAPKQASLPGIQQAMANLNMLKERIEEIKRTFASLGKLPTFTQLQNIVISPTVNPQTLQQSAEKIKQTISGSFHDAVEDGSGEMLRQIRRLNADGSKEISRTEEYRRGLKGKTVEHYDEKGKYGSVEIDEFERDRLAIEQANKAESDLREKNRQKAIDQQQQKQHDLYKLTEEQEKEVKKQIDKAYKERSDAVQQSKEDAWKAKPKDPSHEAIDRQTQKEINTADEADAKRREQAVKDQAIATKELNDRLIQTTNAQRLLNEANEKSQSGSGWLRKKDATSTTVAGGKTVSTQSMIFTRQTSEGLESAVYSFDRLNGKLVNAKVTSEVAAASINKVGTAAKMAGRNFLDNTIHITTWAASVGTLYGSLRLARAGLQSFINTQAQSARLSVVFRGVGGSAGELRDEVLALAAAYGRSATEAMEATISWSRMGLSKKQTVEAVRVSLQAANVAEMTAGEATEHLSAIMLTYKLRVAELSGVLGHLNHVSNTYSVTNKEMLTGITRVAAVAQQAGLPLSELIGILGATVGATKQSGANIGNALKSIITAVGNPAIQNLLKSFNVEVKASAEPGELREFSDIMRDLYIAYEKSSSQMQSLLRYSIAGKTQASRLQAMFDSMAKAQQLAIMGQLNLNSAEEENKRIVETLRSQMQGLVTEWERFVSIQGKMPAKALSEITMAMKNVLAIGNMQGVNSGVQILGMMLTIVIAKLAITGLQMQSMAGKSGILANTLQRLGVAWRMLGDAAVTSVARFHYAAEKAFSKSPDAFSAAKAGYADVAKGLWRLGSFIGEAKIGEKVSSWGMGFRTLGTAVATAEKSVGFMVRSLSVALVALWEFAIPIIAITGAILLLNRAMEFMGRSSASQEKKFSQLDATLEMVSKRAKAFADTARMLDTAKEILSAPTVGEDEKDKWRKVIQEMTPDIGTKLSEAGTDRNKVRQILSEASASFYQAAAHQAAIEFDLIMSKIKTLKAEIERLKTASFPDKKLIDSKEAEKYELQSQLVKKTRELTDAQEELLSRDVATLTIIEKQKQAMESIAEIYNSFSSASPLSKHLIDAESVRAQIEQLKIYDRQLDGISQKNASLRVGYENQRKAIQGLITKKDEEIAQEDRKVPMFTNVGSMVSKLALPSDISPPMRKLLSDKAKLERELSSIVNPAAVSEAFVIQQKGKNETQRNELQSRLNAMVDPAEIARKAEVSRMQINNQLAQARGRSMFVGDNDTDQKIAGMRGLEQLYKQEADLANNAKASEVERDGARTRAAEVLTQMQKTYVDLVAKQWELEKDILDTKAKQRKEFEKALLLSGPGEMLKRLAAFRIAQRGGGRSIGSLMAMDPSMREMVMKLNGTTPESMELAAQRARLSREWKYRTGNATGPTQAQLDAMIGKTAYGQSLLAANRGKDSLTMTATFQPMIDSAIAAGTALKQFSKDLVIATDHIAIIPDVVRSLIEWGKSSGGAKVASTPATPGQFNGVGTSSW